MNTVEQLKVIERYVAAYNRFHVGGMTENLHPEIVFQTISNGEISAETTGIEPFSALAEQSKALFSRRRQQIIHHRFEADKIRVEIDFSGTLAVDLPDGAKAGDVLEVPGRSEFVFSEGKIIRITEIN